MSAHGEPRVYLVGARWRHHAEHSGYDHFAVHVGRRLRSLRVPLPPPRGSRIEAGLTSMHAGMQMLWRRDAIFHALDGDRDLETLVRFAGHRTNTLIATLHAPRRPSHRPSLLQSLERLDALVVLSEAQRESFRDHFPEDRLFTVPHGIDTRFFSPRPERSSGTESALITVGENFRDFRTLAEAMETVWRRTPGVKLVAVGVPAWAKRLLADVRRSRVKFFDGVSDVQLRELYRRSSAAVFALTAAGANNALLEAMACGLPLVVTDVGGVPEYVGTDALLCPVGDTNMLAERIVTVLESQALARRLGDGARARAMRFDYEEIAAQVSRVYRAVGARGLGP